MKYCIHFKLSMDLKGEAVVERCRHICLLSYYRFSFGHYLLALESLVR